MTTAADTASVHRPGPAPAWARRSAHAIALCVLPSGLWRLAMAAGIPVGYSERVLREHFAIPGWGVLYLVGLTVLAEAAALAPLLLVTDRWRPLAPRALWNLSRAACALVLLFAVWQLVVAFTVESRTYLEPGAAQLVQGLVYAPLCAVPFLLVAVTWSYGRRSYGRRSYGRRSSL